MADFKDKFSDKSYKINTYAQLSASVASNPVVDGRVHEFIPEDEAIEKLPFRIKQGDQAKFFPGLKEGTSDGKIETGSIIRDTERQIVYVPIKKKNLQDNIIGVGSYISSSFSSNAYQTISASFASKFSNVSDDTLITYLVEEFYQPKAEFTEKAAFAVGSLTASFDVLESGSNTSSFSAIDQVGYTASNSSKHVPNFEFKFPTENFITHWLFSFPGSGGGLYRSSIFLESAIAQFGGGNESSGSFTSSFNLTDNQFLQPSSGSKIATSTRIFSNTSNKADGQYHLYSFKTKISGDADSGSLYDIDSQFLGQSEIIVYPYDTTIGSISSGSFQYHATSRNDATGSSTIKTLYFVSGSGGLSEANSDYGFFVTGAISTRISGNLYTPVHLDEDLRYNAVEGFYSPSGSQYSSSIYVQTSSTAVSGKGPTFAQQLVL